MKSIRPTAADETFRDAALDLLRRHASHLPADHILALAAQLVGQIIALQDQRTMTRDHALAIVVANIEHGNQMVLNNLNDTKGTA